MNDLSVELWSLVFDGLDRETQKNARLTCKAFEAAVTPLVFEEFSTGCYQCLLLQLQEIATSRLARHVRKLVLYRGVIANIDRSTWLDKVVAKDFGGSPQRIDYDWQQYQLLLQEQELWMQDCKDDVSENAIAKFPNLKEVSLLPIENDDEEELYRPLPYRLLRIMNMDPIDWRFTISSSRAGAPDLCEKAVQTLLQALAVRNRQSPSATPLTSLNLDLELTGTFSLEEALGSWSDIQTIFTSVKKLHVRWGISSTFGFSPNLDLRSTFDIQLSKVLATATQLEVLCLDHINTRLLETSDFKCRLDIFDPTRSIHYPCLRELSVGLDVPAADLIQFLQRHSESLKSLSVGGGYVGDGPAFLKAIPEVLKLEDVRMECIGADGFHDFPMGMMRGGTDADHEKARQMREFLLGKRDEMPNPRGWDFAEDSERGSVSDFDDESESRDMMRMAGSEDGT